MVDLKEAHEQQLATQKQKMAQLERKAISSFEASQALNGRLHDQVRRITYLEKHIADIEVCVCLSVIILLCEKCFRLGGSSVRVILTHITYTIRVRSISWRWTMQVVFLVSKGL